MKMEKMEIQWFIQCFTCCIKHNECYIRDFIIFHPLALIIFVAILCILHFFVKADELCIADKENRTFASLFWKALSFAQPEFGF